MEGLGVELSGEGLVALQALYHGSIEEAISQVLDGLLDVLLEVGPDGDPSCEALFIEVLKGAFTFFVRQKAARVEHPVEGAEVAIITRLEKVFQVELHKPFGIGVVKVA